MTYEHTKWREDLTTDLANLPGDEDHDHGAFHSYLAEKSSQGHTGWDEFSKDNKQCILEKWQALGDKVKVILEIGTDLSGPEKSSTQFFIDNKSPDTKLICIDIRDISSRHDPANNVYAIVNDSSDYLTNVETMKSWGVEQIDIFPIDGWHSINQIKRDWEYTRLLSPHGFVAFHDTGCHTGPKNFLPAMDRARWEVINNACPNDWGLGLAWRKHD